MFHVQLSCNSLKGGFILNSIFKKNIYILTSPLWMHTELHKKSSINKIKVGENYYFAKAISYSLKLCIPKLNIG